MDLAFRQLQRDIEDICKKADVAVIIVPPKTKEEGDKTRAAISFTCWKNLDSGNDSFITPYRRLSLIVKQVAVKLVEHFHKYKPNIFVTIKVDGKDKIIEVSDHWELAHHLDRCIFPTAETLSCNARIELLMNNEHLQEETYPIVSDFDFVTQVSHMLDHVIAFGAEKRLLLYYSFQTPINPDIPGFHLWASFLDGDEDTSELASPKLRLKVVAKYVEDKFAEFAKKNNTVFIDKATDNEISPKEIRKQILAGEGAPRNTYFFLKLRAKKNED